MVTKQKTFWGSESRPWVTLGKQAKGETQPRVLCLGGWELCWRAPLCQFSVPIPHTRGLLPVRGLVWGPDMCQPWALILSYFLPLSPPAPLTSACHSLEAGAESLFSMAGLMLGSGTWLPHGQKVLQGPLSLILKLRTWESPGCVPGMVLQRLPVG